MMPDPRYPHGPDGHRIEVLHDMHLHAGRADDPAGAAAAARAADAVLAEQARRRADIAARLAAATTIADAAALLADHGDDATRPDAQAVWARLVAEVRATAPFEIVAVRGRHTVLGHRPSRGLHVNPGVWTEAKGAERVPVWRSQGAGRRLRPRVGEFPEEWETGFDVWLDAAGNAWSGSLGTVTLGIHYSQARMATRIVLPRGAELRTERVGGRGERRRQVDGPAAVVGDYPEHIGYPSAVAEALRAIATG
jgi:hypothetical protein